MACLEKELEDLAAKLLDSVRQWSGAATATATAAAAVVVMELVLPYVRMRVFFGLLSKSERLLCGGTVVPRLLFYRGSKVAEEASRTSMVLKHSRDVGDKNKDVTTLEWNRDGTLLATGDASVVIVSFPSAIPHCFFFVSFFCVLYFL